MKVKIESQRKINVITLGCSKNIYDSEVLMGQLRGNNLPVIHESNDLDFDTVIINTCGFIDVAKQESVDTILAYAQAKQEGKVNKVYVTGCLSERYANQLAKEIPEVDAWFGTNDLPRLLKTLKANYRKELVGERLLTTPSHYAYFKISEGCDRPCSFCAIPLMRGKHVSTPIETLVERAKVLAQGGTKELIIIAQDSTYYGLDLYGERKLADLLSALAKVEGIIWIRLHYAFPAGFPEDILAVIHNEPKVCKYLDIPLQHISNPILRSMRRGTTHEKTKRLLHTIREHVPGVAIRTTFIVGYPGETEEDFYALTQFVKEQRFERMGVFAYSHEENTHAFQLEDSVPDEIKQKRVSELMDIQQEIAAAHNQEKVGQKLRVLVDRKESGFYVCRTEFDSPEVDNELLIEVEGSPPLTIGEFYWVEVTGADDFDLYAVLA
jgi:ribosomal protein S12 methylthiotransferase